MDPVTHTLISLACIGIGTYVGSLIGSYRSYQDGYHDGVQNGIVTIMDVLESKFGMRMNYEIEIRDENIKEDDV